ncbi:hypothetical protein Pst134EA_023047 [Puccinia striiformis f. sp. tritici]|uniref:hypothetical protein n=1 Tax=Puccinia striiformis f. sp. tritici TaxID=168172 RepID=UPI0020075805|nr:hypothetical protein Pst134EA_023047 [Puccinia striiformis f. sp. tritici]KAH9455587.1 hypothetical protein Pst134EA_023047 [Puccinia striiformis f. sp. tritici]
MGTPSYINCLQANNGWPTHPVIQSKNSQLNSDTKEEKHNHHIKPNPLNLPSSSLHRHKILNTGERSQKKVTFDFSKRDYSLKKSSTTVSNSTVEDSEEEEQPTQIASNLPNRPNNNTRFIANEVGKGKGKEINAQPRNNEEEEDHTIFWNDKGRHTQASSPSRLVSQSNTNCWRTNNSMISSSSRLQKVNIDQNILFNSNIPKSCRPNKKENDNSIPQPSINHLPPSGHGCPQQIFKDLAVSVINFIVNKNPIEMLLDLFLSHDQLNSTIGTSQLHSLQNQDDQQGDQGHLSQLLKSSEKIQLDGSKIQDSVESLRKNSYLSPSSLRPPQILSFFKNNSLSNCKKNQNHPNSSKSFLFGFATLFFPICMIINLFRIGTHHSLIKQYNNGW